MTVVIFQAIAILAIDLAMTEVAPGSWMVRDVTYPGNRGWGAIRQDRGRAIM